MNNSKNGFIIIIILSVILVGVIAAGTIKDKHESKKDKEEYQSSMAANEEEATPTEEDNSDTVSTEDSSKNKGLIEKLRAKQDVRVLLIGDDMAMSKGKSSESGIWSEGIKNLLEKTYASKTEITVLAEAEATTETALKTVQKNDISKYDLVIVCYGNNDSKTSLKLENFKNNYTSLINQIKNKNNNALVIAVLENSLELNNSYRLAVSDVATANSLILADMRGAFNSSGMKEASLAKNGFPNDQGYQIYTQTIGNKIKEAIG